MKDIKNSPMSNPYFFSTVGHLRFVAEAAHWCSTCDFSPLKFCYPGAAEIYQLLKVPIKKPMHCLTTKLISYLTEKNMTHSVFRSFSFFKLKKRFPSTTLQQTTSQCAPALPLPAAGHKWKTGSRIQFPTSRSRSHRKATGSESA